MNHLIDELKKIAEFFEANNIKLIIVGGLGLYFREQKSRHRSPRYPKITSRTTEDIDLLVEALTISSREKMEMIRSYLTENGYQAKTNYFQWYHSEKGTYIDLLAQIPIDRSKVKISIPRIRPKKAYKIHAFAMLEAQHIDFNLDTVSGETFYLPSAINFLILKLHAFNDRCEDEKSDFGRHHAFDIFRVIAGMDEQDWNIANQHRHTYGEQESFLKTKTIVFAHFTKIDHLGIVRLRQNIQFSYNSEIEMFIADLAEIFMEETS